MSLIWLQLAANLGRDAHATHAVYAFYQPVREGEAEADESDVEGASIDSA